MSPPLKLCRHLTVSFLLVTLLFFVTPQLATAAETDVADALGWMQRTAKAQLRASAVPMNDGTTAFPPQAGAGYGAFWLRDYAYMLEGCPEAFSDREVIDAYQTFIGGMTPEGVCVDCIKFDGTPIYKPGFGTMGVNPVADGSQFTVDVAYHTYQKTQDISLIETTIDRLEDAMAAIPTNPTTGLVHIVPGSPQERCPYGFTDTIPKQGDVLFSSLLYFQAAKQMAELHSALGNTADRTRWVQETIQIGTNIRDTFWNPSTGLFDAATVQCDQPDIWGSAFAVYLNVADVNQVDSIANYFQNNYGEIVQRGQIRHLPGGMYWEGAGGQDRYQNGAYWGTPSGWFVYTLDKVNSSLADQTILDLVNDLQANGVNEWVNGSAFAVPNYNSTIALPLDAILQIREASPPDSLLVEEGGTFAEDNIAAASAGGVAFAWDELDYGGVHTIAHLNDEIYGNDNSWIGSNPSPTLGKGFAGIAFDGVYEIDRIAFGRDNLDEYEDRYAGEYLLQYTTVPNPDKATSDENWTDITTIWLPADSFGNPNVRHLYEFSPVSATGIRLIVPYTFSQSSGQGTAIDEIEVYRVASAIEGDLNGDGSVGSADLDIVRAHWGESVASGDRASGDPSGDGMVGSADLDMVRASWGNNRQAVAVPEPAVLPLLCGALLSMFAFHRKKFSKQSP